MKSFRLITTYLLATMIGLLGMPLRALPQATTNSVQARLSNPSRDGQRDFDFNIGTWKTHILRLQHPLTGSNTWVETTGTVAVRKIWNGRANLEEIEADGPAGHIEGLTLRLYDPKSQQWSLHWANSNDGTLGQPAVGEFRNGRGEFYDQEMFKGRAILVRQVYSNASSNSYHFEQAFSEDGGKTWEPNWVANLTRETSANLADTDEKRQHDFDFNFGHWKTHVSRLQHPLTGSHVWIEFDGTSLVQPVWNGRASLIELTVTGPSGPIEGLGLRLYNPQTRQWNLNWVNSTDNVTGVPMIGEFNNGRGEFFDQETFKGRAIFVQNHFSDITSDSSRFEQAFSDDGAKTWETNWVMTFVRLKD